MHHLPIPQELQANISYHFYPSGHMIYLHTDVLKQLHADVSSFINTSKARFGLDNPGIPAILC